MMRTRLGWTCLAFALACPNACLWAQFKPADPPPQSSPTQSSGRQTGSETPPVFSVKVNLVRLLVSVRNAAGALLTDLNKQDFQVLDSNVPQEIAVFERNTSLPLSVAILVDTSGSTQKDLHYEVESILRFIPTFLETGNRNDAFALFSFNWRTSLEADFSRSQKRAEKSLHALRGEGGTSLYDAIYLASDALSDRDGRHVMVIVTDGGDTTSYKRYDDALVAAQRADTVIYPILVIPIEADAGRNTGGEHALATLASSTGGRTFYPEGFDQLDAAFTDILRELRTQYLLGFYPKDVRQEPRSFHRVKVELHDPGFRVSARSGYYDP
jgi:Ca-activated chloride channel family protein